MVGFLGVLGHFVGMGTAGWIVGGVAHRFVTMWGIAWTGRLDAFAAWNRGWLGVW